jgi:hypothetical protein
MSSPIYVPPATGQYTLTNDQYEKAVTILAHTEDVVNFDRTGQYSGTFSAESVSFSWTYIAEAGTLSITILSKHSIKAKLAPNEMIFGLISDKLKTLFTT